MKEEKKPCEEVVASPNEEKTDTQQWWESAQFNDTPQESGR